MNSVMVSESPSNAVINARAVAVLNRCVSSKFTITTSTLDYCGG